MGCGTCPAADGCDREQAHSGEMILVGMDDGKPIYMTPEELDEIRQTPTIDTDLQAEVRKTNRQWLGAIVAFVLGMVFAAIAGVIAAQSAIESLGG